MYRSMMQVFVKESGKALEFYQMVFDSEAICAYYNQDGTLAHSELSVHGQILAVSELADENAVTGNTMMFCLHFGEGQEDTVRKIYAVLKEEARSLSPLGPCDYSPLQTVLVDRFGVCWCIFV